MLKTRVLSQLLENTVSSFAAILMVFLFGTALGVLIYQKNRPLSSSPGTFSFMLLATAFFCLSITMLRYASVLLVGLQQFLDGTYYGAIAAELFIALLFILLPTMAMGVTFSHLAQSLKGRDRGVGRAGPCGAHFVTRTFLEVFRQGQAFLAHYSLEQPIIGLVGGRQKLRFPENWYDKRKVEKTGDVVKLHQSASDPLLAVVRQSVDFSAAYFPLVSIAYDLYPHDAEASYQLFRDLERANPLRPEAGMLRQRLFVQ